MDISNLGPLKEMKIKIPEETKKKLKILAAKDMRSLNNYTTLALIKYTEDQNNPNIYDLSNLPPDSSVTLKATQKPHTRYQTVDEDAAEHFLDLACIYIRTLTPFRIKANISATMNKSTMPFTDTNGGIDEFVHRIDVLYPTEFPEYHACAAPNPEDPDNKWKFRWAHSMPEEKQIEYLKEWDHCLEHCAPDAGPYDPDYLWG